MVLQAETLSGRKAKKEGIRGNGVPAYGIRLKRKAEELLSRTSEHPLRNQQTRIINRYQRYERLQSAHNATNQ